MTVSIVWRAVIFLMTVAAMSWSAMLHADDKPVSVRVGGYQFEPFVEGTGGLSVALARFLSEQQTSYQFEFIEIPARRRYDLLTSGKIDMVFFELPLWGWNGYADEIVTSSPLVRGYEVFVARRDHPLGQEVFTALHKRKIALTFGYHYAFVGLSSDPDAIRANYDVVFAQEQLHALRHLMGGNVDLAVVNDMFLAQQIKDTPALQDTLRVGERVDQRYELPILLRRNAPISVSELNAILAQVKTDGRLRAFLLAQEVPASAILAE